MQEIYFHQQFLFWQDWYRIVINFMIIWCVYIYIGFLELIPSTYTHYTSEHEHGTPHQIHTWNRKAIVSLSIPREPGWLQISLSIPGLLSYHPYQPITTISVASFGENAWTIASNLVTPVDQHGTWTMNECILQNLLDMGSIFQPAFVCISYVRSF